MLSYPSVIFKHLFLLGVAADARRKFRLPRCSAARKLPDLDFRFPTLRRILCSALSCCILIPMSRQRLLPQQILLLFVPSYLPSISSRIQSPGSGWFLNIVLPRPLNPMKSTVDHLCALSPFYLGLVHSIFVLYSPPSRL